MKVDVIDFEMDEVVGTVSDDGQLETDDGALAQIAGELSEEGGIQIVVPGGTESAIAYGEWTITPEDEGFLRAFFEYLPSPFTAEASTLNSLPNYQPPDEAVPEVEEEGEPEEAEKADASVTSSTSGTGQAVYSPRDEEEEDDPAEKAAEQALGTIVEAAGASVSVGERFYSNVNETVLEVIEAKEDGEYVVSDGDSHWDETPESIAYKLLSGEWEEPEMAEKMADSALSELEQMYGGKLPVEKETAQNESDALSAEWGDTGNENSPDYEEVDEMLRGMHKRACWWDGDDLSKAPPIWNGEESVPEFVKEVIEQVIDGNVVFDKFAGYSREAAQRIQESFRDNLTQPQGWSLESLVRDLQEMFPGMDDEKALNIARTESSAILNTAREEAYEERADADEYVYYWQGPSDHRITEVCREIKEEVENRGGAVPMNELKSILREKALKYEGTREGGTPERVDEWTPHYQCRHTFIRDVRADL